MELRDDKVALNVTKNCLKRIASIENSTATIEARRQQNDPTSQRFEKKELLTQNYKLSFSAKT